MCCCENGFFCAIGFVVDGDVWDIGVVVCSAVVVVAVGLLNGIDCWFAVALDLLTLSNL